MADSYVEEIFDFSDNEPGHDIVNAQKRKRNVDGESQSKRKAKRKKKAKQFEDILDLDHELHINAALGKMDQQLLADFVARQTKRFEPTLSVVELEDRRVPERAFLDTSEWPETRIADHLPHFLEEFTPGKNAFKELCQAPTSQGSPHTLVVTGAGLRAADLTRALRKFQTKNATVAKLFAKHIKLKEAMEMAKKTRMNIGVGTPQRILDLLEAGAISSETLKRIVIDASHINEKNRGILDMKETQTPLVNLLTRPFIKDRLDIEDKRIAILFF